MKLLPANYSFLRIISHEDMAKKTVFAIFLLFCAVAFLSPLAHAQDVPTLGVSMDVPIESDEGTEILPGSIISFVDGKFVLATVDNEEEIFGVITDNPSVVFSEDTATNVFPLLRDGEAAVRVSGEGGSIVEGDFITASSIPGVGKKAEVTGQIIGIAMENFSGESADATGEIYVRIDPKVVFIDSNIRLNLIELLKNGFQVPFLTPLTSLRYILAAIIAAGAVGFAFLSFGRISASSVDAIGRNPLASRSIKASVLLNFILTVIIVVVGLSISYMILVL